MLYRPTNKHSVTKLHGVTSSKHQILAKPREPQFSPLENY